MCQIFNIYSRLDANLHTLLDHFKAILDNQYIWIRWQNAGRDVVLQWPTQVINNPVDDSITILDEGYFLVLSTDETVYPLAIDECIEDEEW